MARRKSWRLVHIDGGAWRYRIGAVYVPIYSPAGEKHLVRRCMVEHSRVDGRYGYGILPSNMKKYIEEEILGRKEPVYKSALHALATCAE